MGNGYPQILSPNFSNANDMQIRSPKHSMINLDIPNPKISQSLLWSNELMISMFDCTVSMYSLNGCYNIDMYGQLLEIGASLKTNLLIDFGFWLVDIKARVTELW